MEANKLNLCMCRMQQAKQTRSLFRMACGGLGDKVNRVKIKFCLENSYENGDLVFISGNDVIRVFVCVSVCVRCLRYVVVLVVVVVVVKVNVKREFFLMVKIK